MSKRRDLTKSFIDEIYTKPPKKTYPTNKSIVVEALMKLLGVWIYQIWIDYGPKNKDGFRYILVVIDKFSKFGWTNSIKEYRNASQSIVDEFSKIIKTSKRKPNLIETDRGKEFYNNIFKSF